MLELFYKSIPGLKEALDNNPHIRDRDQLWSALRRLLLAHAPSGGIALPGAILDDLMYLVNEAGLSERFLTTIGSTGNSAIWLGAEKAVPDIIVATHLDRPTFRVRSLEEGILYPMCAIRVPAGGYQTGAKALRFQDGRLIVGATGKIVFEHRNGQDVIVFEAEHGSLEWYDVVTMDVIPMLEDGVITGTGLDNCLGVITVLATAISLFGVEAVLKAQNKRLLLVFTDQEEGIPDAYFGHGAARLTFAVPQPTYGCVIADAHTVNGPALIAGHGTGHGTVSAWSRGSVVPPNYVSLAVALSAAVNAVRPNTVQMNTGYLSRSDDMALGRWSQILGMIGAPMTDAHTGHERAHLVDVPAAITWLTYYTLAVLRTVPDINQRYALHRL